jgi:pSer/pThr/pTyr-binding forkhead associated (FHA) protein
LPDLCRLRAGHAYLIVCSGPARGTAFTLDGYAVVGRHALCDIVLDDITVSRHHAEVERDGEKFTIADLRSLNGTYVNGERVEQAELTSGDALQIGRFRLVFVSRK